MLMEMLTSRGGGSVGVAIATAMEAAVIAADIYAGRAAAAGPLPFACRQGQRARDPRQTRGVDAAGGRQRQISFAAGGDSDPIVRSDPGETDGQFLPLAQVGPPDPAAADPPGDFGITV